jgi:tetratricopeptide (TPR) repeat protein
MIRYQFKQWTLAREDFLALLKAPPGETQSVFYSVDGESNTPITTTQTNMTSSVLNYLGLVDTKMKNYKRATQYLDSAISFDSGRAEFFINRGWCYQEMFDTLQAIKDYQKALSLNPESSLARHNIAVLSAKKGNLKEVENLLTEAIMYDTENANYFTARAINYTAQGFFENALKDYNSSIHLDSANADVWLKHALIKQMLKDYNGALADITQSITLKDDNEKTWLYRGDLMIRLNRIKEAVEDYTIAITLQPNFGKAYIDRAVAYQRLGNLTKACEDILTAKNLNVSIDELFKTSVCK